MRSPTSLFVLDIERDCRVVVGPVLKIRQQTVATHGLRVLAASAPPLGGQNATSELPQSPSHGVRERTSRRANGATSVNTDTLLRGWLAPPISSHPPIQFGKARDPYDTCSQRVNNIPRCSSAQFHHTSRGRATKRDASVNPTLQHLGRLR